MNSSSSQLPGSRVLLAGLMILAGIAPAVAQFSSPTGVNPTAGGHSTSALYSSHLTIGQGDLVGQLGSQTRTVRPGFLNAFLMNPDRDADGDGIPDENDPDDDNDFLDDLSELLGDRFSPPLPTNPLDPDSDRDGASDGAEAAAGTDPTDPADFPLRLYLIDFARIGNEVALTVSTVPGQDYEIFFSPDLSPGSWISLSRQAGAVGSGLSTFTVPLPDPLPANAFFQVRTAE